MKSAPSPAAVSALKKVQEQFKNWREAKTGRDRIPDSLWQAAAEVFPLGGYSLHKIAKALHLNHTDLKQYAEQHLVSSIQVKPDAGKYSQQRPHRALPESIMMKQPRP